MVLIEDEITLRFLPPLRAAWALKGKQSEVPISGRNDQRVLFGAINPQTGHCVLMGRRKARQEDFCAILRELRRRYRSRPIFLLLDKAPCHMARRSLALAQELSITLIWLPTQCPELNAMDHLWRFLKAKAAANRQFNTVEQLAEHAEQWVRNLSPKERLRLAGLLSPNQWLHL